MKPDASVVVSTTGDRLHVSDMQLTLGDDMQPITAHNVAQKHKLLLCISGFKPDKVMHLLCIRSMQSWQQCKFCPLRANLHSSPPL